MLDIIIYVAIFFQIFILLFGLKEKSTHAFGIASVIFLIIGIGLFTSGFESYLISNNHLIQDVDTSFSGCNDTEDGICQLVTKVLVSITPNIIGTANQQIVFVFATFSTLLSLAFAIIGLNERSKNIAARKKR